MWILAKAISSPALPISKKNNPYLSCDVLRKQARQNVAMKKFLFLFTLLGLSSMGAHAGNMFGPGPFRNGSPLVSGVDGTYQATARAENVTGVFRFAYSGGSQTSNQLQNSWIFFVDGQIQRGGVVASIDNSSLNGILDSQGLVSVSTNQTNNSIDLPYVIINQNNSSAGTFRGKFNLKNPNGAFNGSGILMPSPATTNTIVGISQLDSLELNLFGNTPAGSIFITTNSYITPAGIIPNVEFKFRGVRTSLSSSSATATPATAPAQ